MDIQEKFFNSFLNLKQLLYIHCGYKRNLKTKIIEEIL